MEGGRPENKSEGGGAHAKLLTKLQNVERQQCGSDEVSFGKSVSCNWEDATQLVGQGGSVALSAKERRCRDQDECRSPEEIFQW